MNKKFLENNAGYRQIFETQKEKAKAIDSKIALESESTDIFSMFDKYGDAYKKLTLTSAIDSCMRLTTSTTEKIEQCDYIKALGLVERMSLYGDNVVIVNSQGQRSVIEPLNQRIDSNSSLQAKLKTNDRHNDCHNGSWNLMSELKDVKNKKLVTGFIKGASDESLHLHTWIEFVEGDTDKVADYTLNSVMDKDLYYSLRSVDEKKNSVISEKDFEDEKASMEELFKNGMLSMRIYLYYRDELVREANYRE